MIIVYEFQLGNDDPVKNSLIEVILEKKGGDLFFCPGLSQSI